MSILDICRKVPYVLLSLAGSLPGRLRSSRPGLFHPQADALPIQHTGHLAEAPQSIDCSNRSTVRADK